MPQNEIKVTLTGDASKLIAELKKSGVNIDKFETQAEKAGGSAKTAGMSVSGMVTGLAGLQIAQQAAGWVAGFARESFNAAAQAGRLGTATDSLAQAIGSSGSEMVGAITGASNQTIDRLSAMEAANKAMMFGLVENKDQMAELAQMAVVLGNAMGQDAAKSMDDLTTALGRQSPMILDNLGITLKLEEAYGIYAQQLGKTAESLTETEKKQAFVNAALEKGRQRVEELGGLTEGAATDVDQLSAAWADFQVQFGGLLTMMTGGMDTITGAVRQMEQGAKSWQFVFSTIGELVDQNNTKFEAHQRVLQKLGMTQQQYAYALRTGAITQREYEETVTTVIAEMARQEEMMVRTEAQARAMDAALRGAADASLELAQAELAAAGASQQALDAWGARYQGLDNITRTQGQAGVDLLNTMTGNVTPAQGIVDAIESGMDDIDLGGSFKNVADNLASQLSGAVNQAFGRMQEVAPEGSIIAGMFDAEDPGEFGRRLMALAEQGMEGLDGAWAEAFKNSAGGNPIYAGLLQSIEDGDSAAVAEEANRLLSENLATVIATGLTENLRTKLEEQELMKQVQDIVMEQMTAEGAEEGDVQGLLGAMMGDPALVANDINENLKPAVDDLKTSLGGLGGGETPAAGGGGEGEEPAGGGSALSALIGDSALLNDMLGITLPETITNLQIAMQTTTDDIVLNWGLVDESLITADTSLINITDSTLPTLQTQHKTSADAMVEDWGNVQTAGDEAAGTIVEGMEEADEQIGNLIEQVEKAEEAFRKMADAARDAASAAQSAGSNDPSNSINVNGRATGGPVNAGNLYLVGERGPELFSPTTSGMIIPYRDKAPAAVGIGGGGGGSVVIQNLNLYGVQDARGLFEEVQKVAQSKGLQFSPVM